ncbi:Nucleotidyl transferase [Clostridium liquoris]|jgi:dTDP-glucose pyrophosphorylase|uniref:Nucleotidyl transferase n=1 Tax=Clostridium liquoris TaxID=1289519 RepID=A0A2T0B5S2_9CLOT|nr:sugar phosphate nucleotidyltransferase [Clostridium liquoris]PRR79153.1 Nucleotidyl transferase [Clostridium liquoris]
MVKPTLVIMAAGMGSRYGGLKQIDPVGPSGEIIMDYSIYDAMKAGFGKVVFIIKKEIEDAFRETIGNRISKIVDTAYVYQEVYKVPSNFEVPQDRIKPWGTAHAVLCCKDVVNTPFAVINADDFYGSTSFEEIGKFLSEVKDDREFYNYAMVGFQLENTLTEHGTVARGVCNVDNENYLVNITERTKIKKFEDAAKYTEDGESWIDIPKGSTVSMNTWGFTPSIFEELEEGFSKFLEGNKENILKSEYFLPSVVDNLIAEGKAKVKVMTSKEQWYGVTYREDKPNINKAINDLINSGVYPEKLWD